MLVLTRRAGESIVIDGQITVTVLEARGDQIRIGVDAPRDVTIYREEVYRAVERENTAAAASAARAQALLGARSPDLSAEPKPAAPKPEGSSRPDGPDQAPSSNRTGGGEDDPGATGP